MSSADYKHYNRSSGPTSRSIPIRLISNHNNDYYSSDTDSHHQTYLQRTSSTSSFCSSSSTGSANYRILPVRYSSVDRIIEKPATVTANKRGINVRIRFERPHNHHHHHHHQHRHHHHTEEYEHHHKKHTIKEHQHYGSCPVLNKSFQNTHSMSSKSHHPSNINYIETRSIVRGYSSDQLNKNTHSSTLIIRQQSLPPPSISIKTPRVAYTRIKHIPLDTYSMFKPIITRVIPEEQEE
jgi:hypothetical protein